MSVFRRPRRAWEWSELRLGPALFGRTDIGIGAEVTGCGLLERGSARRERAPFGSPTTGYRVPVAAITSFVVTGAGKPFYCVLWGRMVSCGRLLNRPLL